MRFFGSLSRPTEVLYEVKGLVVLDFGLRPLRAAGSACRKPEGRGLHPGGIWDVSILDFGEIPGGHGKI